MDKPWLTASWPVLQILRAKAMQCCISHNQRIRNNAMTEELLN